MPLTKTNTILSLLWQAPNGSNNDKRARAITICWALAQPQFCVEYFVLIISIVFLNSHHLQNTRQCHLHVVEIEF